MIRFGLMLTLAIAAPYGAIAQEDAPVELPAGSFSIRPDSSRALPNVEVDVVLVIRTGNIRHYRLVRRVTDRDGTITATFADSRTCPAVMAQMTKVETIPMPTFVAPGSNRLSTVPIMIHATRYSLAMRGYDMESNTTSDIELRAQSGSPLAQWSDETLEALDSCWSTTQR